MDRERQERAPMSKKNKLFRLEMYVEHVVHRLEGDHADYTLFLSQMMHAGTLEMLVDVFTHERRKFFRVRRFVEDAVFMLGQLARRINSHLLPRIIDLHLDLGRLWRSEDAHMDRLLRILRHGSVLLRRFRADELLRGRNTKMKLTKVQIKEKQAELVEVLPKWNFEAKPVVEAA